MDGVVVTNMLTWETAVYGGMSPEIAVWIAHQQLTLGNYNWWEKAHNSGRVEFGKFFVFCGDWAARKVGTDEILRQRL